MNERTDRRMDGRTNESPPVFYSTSSPSGPLPKKATIHKYYKGRDNDMLRKRISLMTRKKIL